MSYTCHSCGRTFNDQARRKGNCSICFSDSVNFCATCAFWELGPVAPDLQQALRPRSRQKQGVIIKKCPAPSRVQDPGSNQLVTDIRAICATIEQQWSNYGFDADHAAARVAAYNRLNGVRAGSVAEADQEPGFHLHDSNNRNGSFSVIAQQMLDDYDKLYARNEIAADCPARKENNLERVMLLFLVSAHERCGYINDNLVHRWDAHQIAQKHFSHHITPAGAPAYIAGARNIALAAVVLGSKIMENLALGKVSSSYAFFQVRDSVPEADRADFVRLSAMLYHLWVKNCPCGAEIINCNFKPVGATGIMVPSIKKKILEADGLSFTCGVEKKLAALYACFDNVPPYFPISDVRFDSPAVQMNGLLTNNQKRFIQSIPKFDTPAGNPMVPCEKALRSRIRTIFKNVKDVLKETPSAPAGSLADRLRRAASDNDREALIDSIIATLNKSLNWIESSFGDSVYEEYHASANRAQFRMLAYAEIQGRDVPWAHVYPDCMNAAADSFPGQTHLPCYLATIKDGRQNAKMWYPQWRYEKDLRIYKGLLQPGERGVLARFRFDTQGPAPNLHYGCNSVIWNNNVSERSVLTIGDKGRPIRSKLILLHDILTCPEQMFGEIPKQPNGKNESNVQVFRQLIEFVNVHENTDPAAAIAAVANPAVTGPAAPASGIRALLLSYIGQAVNSFPQVTNRADGTDSGQRIFTSTRTASSSNTIVECHIFGELQFHRDAACVLACQGRPEVLAAGADPALEPAWMASLTLAGLPFNTVKYRGGDEGVENIAQQKRADCLPDPVGKNGALANVLNMHPRNI
ncbi:MAG TPA: hypothetical protein VHO70_23640 [Chitinispirillaceae bacterium]|nr:hypothetical protein [Chitinispirillaceae bacterium]